MPTTTTTLDRLAALQAEIKDLQQAAITELMEKRNALSHELAQVDVEIGALTGNKPEKTKRAYSRASSATGKNLPLQELKELLAAAPEKTLSIRKDNLDLQNIKTLAAANPQLLKLGGKGAWPTVTLLK